MVILIEEMDTDSLFRLVTLVMSHCRYIQFQIIMGLITFGMPFKETMTFL